MPCRGHFVTEGTKAAQRTRRVEEKRNSDLSVHRAPLRDLRATSVFSVTKNLTSLKTIPSFVYSAARSQYSRNSRM